MILFKATRICTSIISMSVKSTRKSAGDAGANLREKIRKHTSVKRNLLAR